MFKVINIVPHNNLLQKENFNQFTKCGDVCVNDDSTDAYLLCSFCTSTSEERILRNIEQFIGHIKWHRSEYEPALAMETVVTRSSEEIQLLPEEDPINVELDIKPENTVQEYVDNILSQISYDCLLNIIDLFKKCPCLWHSVTAKGEEQFIDPAKCMITKYFNKLTERTESVEYVDELLGKIKSEFLEKCLDESDTSHQFFETLHFLSTSEMAILDESIYTDFRCTICKQKLESWEFLWDHLCECHMEIQDNGLNDNDNNDDCGKSEDEYEEKHNVTEENKPKEDNAEYITEFIETYKNHSRLWNGNHPHYTNRRLREKSYKALMAVMEKYNDVATKRTVLAKIRCFRAQYIYVKRKMHESKDRDYTYIPHIWYYDKLLFLEGNVRDMKNPEVNSQPDPQKPLANNSVPLNSTCRVCNMKFPNSMECLDHVQNFHDSSELQSPDGFFYCPICNIQNKTKYSLVRHLRHTHSSNFKVCDDCGTKFRFLSELVKHRAKEHKDFRPYKCPDCGKGFTDLSYMKIHSVTHRDADEQSNECVTCSVCNKEFQNSVEYVDHMLTFHDSSEFQSTDGCFYCPICNSQNKTNYSFVRHLRHKHNSNFKACDDCGTRFRFLSELAKHRAKEHKDFFPHKCPDCGKGYKDLTNMKVHLINHRNVEDRPHACEICGSKFADRGNLVVHIRRHTRDFKIGCEICDHKVATTTELRSHMLTHTKNYPCICDICGKRFRSNLVLKLHQEENHGNETYPCEICDEKFKSKRKLLKHIETHKPIADQECKICGKKFLRARSLQQHLRRKHKTSIKQIVMDSKKEENYFVIQEIEKA